MTIRVTLQFADERQTWSETYYYQAASAPDDGALLYQAQLLANVRSRMLGRNAGLTRVRLSSVDNPRTVHNMDFVPPLTMGWPPDPAGGTYNAEFGDAALLVKSTCQNDREVRGYQAGHPCVIFGTKPGDNTGLTPQAGWLTEWGYWQNVITNGQWSLRFKINPQNTQIQDIGQSAQYPNMAGIQSASALTGVDTGSFVQITGCKRTNMQALDLNGTWQVHAVQPPPQPGQPAVTWLRDSMGIDKSNFWRLGVMSSIDHTFSPINYHSYERAGSRARGESIGLRRGRSKTRKLHGR
ncbi:MAG TPA: hypothetical protein VF760_12145 [Xanthobacteraceae bacterium]